MPPDLLTFNLLKLFQFQLEGKAVRSSSPAQIEAVTLRPHSNVQEYMGYALKERVVVIVLISL